MYRKIYSHANSIRVMMMMMMMCKLRLSYISICLRKIMFLPSGGGKTILRAVF